MKKISSVREGNMYCINGHYHLFEGTTCIASTQHNKDVSPLPIAQLKERHERFGKFPAVVRFTVDEENNFNIFTEVL